MRHFAMHVVAEPKQGRRAMAAGALVICSVALLVLGWSGRESVELMGVDGAQEKAQADQSMVSSCISTQGCA